MRGSAAAAGRARPKSDAHPRGRNRISALPRASGSERAVAGTPGRPGKERLVGAEGHPHLAASRCARCRSGRGRGRARYARCRANSAGPARSMTRRARATPSYTGSAAVARVAPVRSSTIRLGLASAEILDGDGTIEADDQLGAAGRGQQATPVTCAPSRVRRRGRCQDHEGKSRVRHASKRFMGVCSSCGRRSEEGLAALSAEIIDDEVHVTLPDAGDAQPAQAIALVQVVALARNLLRTTATLRSASR